MKKILLLLLISFVYACAAVSQDSVIRINSLAGDEAISSAVRFRFPEFIKGYVYYKDGTSAQAKFNLNIILDEIQFIHPNGDTLSMIDEEKINYVTIGSSTFYYKKGVMELTGAYKPVKLVINRKYTVTSTDRVGAYGEASGTTPTTSLGSFYANDQKFSIKLNVNATLEKKVTYYFMRDDNDNIAPATKNGIFKLLPAKKRLLDKYLEENRVDFKSETDLKRFLLHVQQIEAEEK